MCLVSKLYLIIKNNVYILKKIILEKNDLYNNYSDSDQNN